MHVNLVGSSRADEREVDDDAVARSRLYVDFLPSTMAQAGEVLSALRAGLIGETHIIGQIGDVITGAVAGRENGSSITMYKSLGIAAQDLACIDHLYRKALAKSQASGAWIKF
jgi:ornithine cyclodeaminase